MAKNTSILLGDYFNNFINEQINSGRFSSASEVVRSALRLFEQEESKKKELIKELIKGEKSGFVENFDKNKFLTKMHKNASKQMDFKISKEAEKDLTRIWNYTFETWSIEQADRYINLVFEEIAYICENPKFGKDFSYIRKGYLRTKVKSHFVFYKINKKEQQIEVIRVLHQRMDIEQRLK